MAPRRGGGSNVVMYARETWIRRGLGPAETFWALYISSIGPRILPDAPDSTPPQLASCIKSCKVNCSSTHCSSPEPSSPLQLVVTPINLVVPVLRKWCSGSSCINIPQQCDHCKQMHGWKPCPVGEKRCRSVVWVTFLTHCWPVAAQLWTAAASVAPHYGKFSHSFRLLTAALGTDEIYYKETRQRVQPGKMSGIFLIWIIDRWMNKWKQQQNICREMKTVERKTLNKQQAWNVWEVCFF